MMSNFFAASSSFLRAHELSQWSVSKCTFLLHFIPFGAALLLSLIWERKKKKEIAQVKEKWDMKNASALAYTLEKVKFLHKFSLHSSSSSSRIEHVIVSVTSWSKLLASVIKLSFLRMSEASLATTLIRVVMKMLLGGRRQPRLECYNYVIRLDIRLVFRFFLFFFA